MQDGIKRGRLVGPTSKVVIWEIKKNAKELLALESVWEIIQAIKSVGVRKEGLVVQVSDIPCSPTTAPSSEFGVSHTFVPHLI